MFKVAFITDLHFGVRGNSDVFLKNNQDYLYNEFIPYLKENAIEHVFIGGDIFDSRQSINIKTFNCVLNFFTKMREAKLKVVVIAGNHDLYLSTSNDLTSLAFLSNLPDVTFIKDGMQPVSIDENNIMFMPWISNTDKFLEDIKVKYDCKICIGHFDLAGFSMNKTSRMSDDGMPNAALTNIFKTVITGHFHTRSDRVMSNGARIVYVGSPYQLTRADTGEDRGFAVLTIDKNELVNLEFINNQKCIRFETVTFPQVFLESQIRGNIVDIMVNYAEKFDELKLDEYKASIEAFGPALKPEIRLIGGNDVNVATELQGFATKTTADLINDFIDEVNIEKKEEVRKEIIDLYNQVKITE
jgi:DNA repair exonuclease SbcCD nuclease subunit